MTAFLILPYCICSKAEFVIYKLKEMGKIADKDIIQIAHQFDALDDANCGKISLADIRDRTVNNDFESDVA